MPGSRMLCVCFPLECTFNESYLFPPFHSVMIWLSDLRMSCKTQLVLGSMACVRTIGVIIRAYPTFLLLLIGDFGVTPPFEMKKRIFDIRDSGPL
jgi:hypothetical protein